MINSDNYEFLTWVNVGKTKNKMEVFTKDSLENFKINNVNVISDLLNYASEILNTVQDEEIKRLAAMKFKSLNSLLKSVQEFDPNIFINGTKLPANFFQYSGLFKFELLIDFMNDMFNISLYCKYTGKNENSKFEQIVVKTKESAKDLGISSIDPIMFEDMLYNSESPYFDTFSCEVNVDSENSIQGDGVSITSLPYLIKVPCFMNNGTFRGYEYAPIKKGQVWINSSKYNYINSVNNEPKLN